MSETQTYKENNLATFTFTPAEVIELGYAGKYFLKFIASHSAVLLAHGEHERFDALMVKGNTLIDAVEKLVRK